MHYKSMVAGMILICATAWCFHLQIDLPVFLKALGWCSGLTLWAYGYYQILRQEQALSILQLSAPMAIFLCMPQVLSQDLYIYFLQGKLALQGVTTYTDGSLNALHDWVRYIDPQWRDCPNHYGTFPMALFRVIALAPSPFVATVLLKLVFAIVGFFCIIMVRRLTRGTVAEAVGPAAFCLSPIFLMQGIGQLHIDLLSCALVFLFIAALQNAHLWKQQSITIALLGSTKFLLFPVFMGLWVLYAITRHKALAWHLWLRVPIAATLLLAASYLPIWQGVATITHPMQYHDNKEPVKSITELLTYAAVFLSDEKPVQVDLSVAKDPVIAQKIALGRTIRPWVQGFALLLAALLAWRTIQMRRPEHILFYLGLILLLVFIVYAPVMHPWYFLLVLPFFALRADQRTVALYLTITFTLANTYEIGRWLGGSTGQIVTIVGTILSVLSYFIGFNRWYIQNPTHD
jgi:hypothetical protein